MGYWDLGNVCYYSIVDFVLINVVFFIIVFFINVGFELVKWFYDLYR